MSKDIKKIVLAYHHPGLNALQMSGFLPGGGCKPYAATLTYCLHASHSR